MAEQDNYLVTGAYGFVGRHFIKQLLASATADQQKIIAIDTVDEATFFSAMPKSPYLKYISHDISKPLPDALALDQAHVVHTAAIMNTTDDELYWQVNVEGTRHILQWAKNNQARQVIFISTGGVYGYHHDRFLQENDTIAPIGVYGHSKLIAENLVKMYHAEYGLNAAVIRLYFPYGEDQTRGIFPFIQQAIKEQRPLYLNRGGKPYMNPIHIHDLVAALQSLCHFANEQSAPYLHTFNLSGDEKVSFLELVQYFEKQLGQTAVLHETETEQGDLLGDNLLIKQTLNWQPKQTIHATYRQDSH